MIQHRPWRFLIGGLVALIVLALPVLSIRLGFGDTGNLPENQTPRQAYDLLAEGFGPGFNGPLIDGRAGARRDGPGHPPAGDRRGRRDAERRLRQSRRSWSATTWRSGPVYPKSAPQDAATDRAGPHPARRHPAADRVDVKVGGITAVSIDFSDYLAGRLPCFIGAVLLFSFILLMVVFRSVLVPLKAVIMNLLSIGAAYGVVVAVFQWGWGKQPHRLGRAGPIEAWVPMMLFAIVFGLSMDYEVFLLSRIKEEYDRTARQRHGRGRRPGRRRPGSSPPPP